MEKMNIWSCQKEEIVKYKEGFKAHPCDEGISYTYEDALLTAEDYCSFLMMSYDTVRLLGDITYSITYNCVNNKYILNCETYINHVKEERLSFELEDDVDFLSLYGETVGVGKAQWLPSNWKELITDEQLHDILQERNIQTIECLIDDDVPDEMKERIAKDWCENNSGELRDYLSEEDKEEIAENYIEDNYNDIADKAFGLMGSYEQREFIKNCIDEF